MTHHAARIGALSALTAVALGAFAAHGLADHIAPEALEWFHTGVRYQMWHAIGLLAVGLAAETRPARGQHLAAWAFGLGILLFSGSLYGLALGAPRALGIVTPFGGAAFLCGWASFAWALGRPNGGEAGDRSATGR